MPAPDPSATTRGGRTTSPGSTLRHTNRTAENHNTSPTSTWKTSVGSCSHPPRNAAGTANTANGQKSDHEKCPARANCTVPITATSTLSVSATGRIYVGAIPAKASTAM